ncbi:MAG: YdcH family protein [Sedimenticola sp.]
MTPNNETLEQMREQLHLLQEEHRDLDDAINRLSEGPYINELQLSRMKKRKLLLKDSIAKIETLLIPDLNA